jgi:hypothetical protein
MVGHHDWVLLTLKNIVEDHLLCVDNKLMCMQRKKLIAGVDEYVKYGAVAMKNHVASTHMNVIEKPFSSHG